MTSAIKYRPDIDGLRAIAVLSVIIFHFDHSWLPGGFIGVDVFFVISGFLITSIILKEANNGQFKISNFYIRRAKRIFPALILVLLLTWIISWFVLLESEFKPLGKHIYSGAFFFSNISLLKEVGYFDVSADLKPLLHLWTLSLEEQFYIFWPLFILLAVKKKWKIGKTTLWIFIVSFILNVFLISKFSSSTFYLIHTRAWELLAGALISIYSFKFASRINLYSAIGMLMILASVFVLAKGTMYPGLYALMPVIGTVLIIASGPTALINKFLSSKILVFIGLISYPLYLWHWPILSFLNISENNQPPFIAKLAAILFTFAFSFLTYRFVEFPLRVNKKFSDKTVAVFLSFILFFVGVLGLITKNQSGWALLNEDKLADTFKVPRFHTVNCMNSFPELKGKYCNLSGDGADVALIGDSHSLAIYPGFEEYFKKDGLNVIQLGKGACLPFIDVEVQNAGNKDICHEVMKPSFDIILNNKKIKKVFLAASWKSFLADGASRKLKDLRSSDNHSNEDIFKIGLIRTMTILQKAGKEVIFMHSVPTLNYSPKACVKLRKLQFGETRKDCTISKDEAYVEQDRYRKIVGGILKSFPNVKTFNPIDVICEARICELIINGEVLYRDEDHLSADGARYLSTKFNF